MILKLELQDLGLEIKAIASPPEPDAEPIPSPEPGTEPDPEPSPEEDPDLEPVPAPS
ncbi:hypothetical protein [Gloeocapsopsis dulcis]|uniref:hypothetical protein n=1 Tax=Gloeocapsopsis dulcis TaxID=2859516 RepID=UPI0012DA94B8|nr:hypothetical protein [Gloeocapsopsis dulcis]WNN88521.1 hypothetical protein P0S91_19875 [Gloeocapsopsis dulcis]